MNKKRTMGALLLTGILLAGLPLGAIASHNYIQDKHVQFEVVSAISPRIGVENFDIWSDINFLDLSQLTGTDNFLRGQTVYVHMSKGPDKVAYPFAITADRPVTNDKSVFSIKGKAVGRQDDFLQIRYSFETFLPSDDLRAIYQKNPNMPSSVVLAVNDQGVPRLMSVEIGEQSYPYRKMEVPALSGLTQ